MSVLQMERNKERASPRGSRPPAFSRTAQACLSCKEKRIKCTGQPGPCQACSKSRRYCHFDFKLDARRKIYEPSTTHRQQQFLLKGLLLSIKLNDSDMVQRLVEAIRNDDSPPNVAKTLQNNIQALHERGELAKKDISETDMITLVLKCLSCPRPRTRTDSTASTAQYDFLGEPSSSHSEWSSASPATHEDFFFDEAFPLQLQSSNCDMAQYSTDSAHSSTDIDSIFTSSTFEVGETISWNMSSHPATD
ncbi:hypothetical protein EDD36DRAFT_78247 [Exophiala viscosa]|uniref:Zn(2)-C6 fungal-type domain-containing protein n=1 Tax=Exophiala viscosa TaxID=2486360 RepID=A0AAN6DR39_9EURO|nr:hypothetical protein EDD36DRAFT_78247 [Exophiala viscosa]